MAKKRAKPRQRAVTRQQAEEQLRRYDRLLTAWLEKLGTAARRVEQYRKRTIYYQNRVSTMQAAEVASLEQAVAEAQAASGRQLRAIDLGGPNGTAR